MKKTKILVGKGGVGKTSICSAFVRILSEKCPQARILAIDADPAVGLATALGVEVRETLDDLRLEIIEKAAQGAGKEAIELLGEVRYRIFDALIEKDGFSFLAIGRPEGAGCYCAVNAYLKEVIEMITDCSKKGMQVIRSIKQVADELVTYEKCGVIINRVDDPELFSDLEIPDMDVLSVIESDGAHAKNDILGKTIFELPADAPVLRGSAKALEQML